MRKKTRKVIAISDETGERREFHSAYAMAKELGVADATVFQALDRCGYVLEWRVFDTPEVYRDKIKMIQECIRIVEGRV
jgi:hypothetical protein